MRIIVPYAAGGVADVTTRLVAQRLADRLQAQFVVDNRPGAGGITAASSVKSAASRVAPQLPSVPTVKERGLSDFVVTSWNGIAAPAGTPGDMARRCADVAHWRVVIERLGLQR